MKVKKMLAALLIATAVLPVTCLSATAAAENGTTSVDIEKVAAAEKTDISGYHVYTKDSSSYSYDGKAKTPTVSVTDYSTGTTLTQGTDYTVSYINNVSAGTATIIVTGIGSYTGTATGSFEIEPLYMDGYWYGEATLSTNSFAYNGGKAIQPQPTVTYEGKTLTKDKDYTLSYESDCGSVGGHYVTVLGKGNYTGSMTCYYNVFDNTISSNRIEVWDTEYTYTGSAITPDISVSNADGNILTKNKDYTVSYTNNTNVGTGSITIKGIGDYTGTVTKKFTITKASLNSWWDDISYSFKSGKDTYDYRAGNAVKPEVTVKFNGKTLTKDTDYTLTYDSDSGKIGYHTVVIKGKGNFTDSYSLNYYVDTASISSGSVSFSKTYTYNGKAQKPTPTVKVDGVTLKKGTDYEVSYKNNKNAGTATVTITGINGYYGTCSGKFTIKKKTVKKITSQNISDKSYTGSKIVPTPVIKADGVALTKGTDYTVTCKNNTEPGTATFTVKLNSNYTGTTSKTIKFNIIIGKVSSLKATAASTNSIKVSWKKMGKAKYKVYRYNSSKKSYKLLTTTSSTSYTDKKLSQATAYTYKVVPVYSGLTGKNNTVKGNTKVAAPTLTLKSYNKKAGLSWTKNSKADGYQIYWCKGDTSTVPYNNYYSIKDVVCTTDFTKLTTLKSASKTSYTKTGLSTTKNYHFKVRAYKKLNGKTVYSAWSDIEDTINTANRLNAATLKSHNSYTIVHARTKTTTTTTHTLTSEEKKILKNFANKYFKKGWTNAEKVEFTANWIRTNMVYGEIPTNSHTKNIFELKKGQCSDYNGALVEMMTYLGYDVQLVEGWWNVVGGSHYWGEVKIDGATYVMEVGETKSDNATWSYKWEYLCLRYSEASSKYLKNLKSCA
jgi:hypothetical protein